jgi:hypothetical protein
MTRHKWLQTALKILFPVIIAVNCIGGTAGAIQQLTYAAANVSNIPNKYAREIYAFIDTERSLTIADFRSPAPDMFYMAGSRTQNRYYWYSPDTPACESIAGVNTVKTIEEMSGIIKNLAPDFILIERGYYEVYDEFIGGANGFVLTHVCGEYGLYKRSYEF